MAHYISQIFKEADGGTAKCPNCNQSLILENIDGKINTDSRHCKFCGVWIDESKIVLSNLVNETLSESIQESNEVPEREIVIQLTAVFIIFELLLWYFFISDIYLPMHCVFIMTSFIFWGGINTCNKWIKKYGEIRIYDKELIGTKKRVRNTRILWAFGLALNLIIWLLTFIKSYIN